jgi:hypothetical protein
MSQQSHQPSLLNRIARVLLCLHNGDHGSSESRPGGNEESPVGSRFVLRRVRRCPAAVMGAMALSVRTLAVPSPFFSGADRIPP